MQISSLVGELDALSETTYFGHVEGYLQLNNVDFDIMFQTIRQVAPLWNHLLQQLMQHSRAHQDSYVYNWDPKYILKWAFAVLGIVCHSHGQ